MAVAYTIVEVIQSLRIEKFNGAWIPTDKEGILFLVYTQEEKKFPMYKGVGNGFCVMITQPRDKHMARSSSSETEGIRVRNSVPERKNGPLKERCHSVYSMFKEEKAHRHASRLAVSGGWKNFTGACSPWSLTVHLAWFKSEPCCFVQAHWLTLIAFLKSRLDYSAVSAVVR